MRHIALVLITLQSAILGSTLHVPLDHPTIQSAINATVPGDTVLVQPGIYLENINFNGKNIVLSSNFLSSGDTSAISTTIIDGNAAGSTVTFSTFEDTSAQLMGFTVRNGLSPKGGGIACETASPTILNCNIINNRVGTPSQRGAGIYLYSSAAVIQNCNIMNNELADSVITLLGGGGGIYCEENSAPLIKGVLIHGNSAYNCWGGGLASYNSAPMLEDVFIQNNITLDQQCGHGGGLYLHTSPATLDRVSIRNNVSRKGGGISCVESDIRIHSSIVAFNQVSSDISSGVGGGLYCSNSNPIITNSEFLSNRASWGGGGIICLSNSSPKLSNVIISDNIAESFYGAGVYCEEGSNLELMNVTITGNTASGADARGGGLFLGSDSNPIIVNSILWNNSPQNIYLWDIASLSIAYSDIGGGLGDIDGRYGTDDIVELGGNINADPHFIDALQSDFHLSSNSACISMGTDSIEFEGQWIRSPLNDFEGQARPAPVGTPPDMGAYESTWGISEFDGPVFFVDAATELGFGNGSESYPYKTIQSAINRRVDGDTLVVKPGIYTENIDFLGKSIVLGSLFLLTGDTNHIDDTVIDGNHDGTVIRMALGEDAATVICGFTITNGYARDMWYTGGGGILCDGSSPTLRDLRVYGNTAGLGGGIYLQNSNSVLRDIEVTNNIATRGGGIYFTGSGLEMRNISILNNESEGHGGGMVGIHSSLEMLDSQILMNQTTESYGAGGGLYVNTSLVRLHEVEINGNTSGGNGGGIFVSDSTSLEMTQVSICQNQAGAGNVSGKGGGVYTWISSSLKLVNVTVADNSAAQSGGVHAISGANLVILNSILWGNTPPQITKNAETSILVSHSNIQGGAAQIDTSAEFALTWQNTNLDIDPEFTQSDESHDYYLRSVSPCIDAGTEFFIHGDDTLINVDPDHYFGASPDMGRFEFVADRLVVHPGDTDNNGIVNALDILPLGVYFLRLETPRPEASLEWVQQEVYQWNRPYTTFADCNGDGIIDEKDVIALGVNWGKTHELATQGYSIDPLDSDIRLANNEAFMKLLASLKTNQSDQGIAMRRVLEEILQIRPTTYALFQNHPNPFNPITEIKFSLPRDTEASLTVYNLRGEVEAVLLDQKLLPAGHHSERFPGVGHSSGIYFYEFTADNFREVKKMLLVK